MNFTQIIFVLVNVTQVILKMSVGEKCRNSFKNTIFFNPSPVFVGPTRPTALFFVIFYLRIYPFRNYRSANP